MITVKIQTEERMKAITELSVAIRNVAEALRAVPAVNITGCEIHGNPAVAVATDTAVKETTIECEDTEE